MRDSQTIIILSIIVLLVMLISIIFIVVLATTKSKRNYNRIKNHSEAEGTITNIKIESIDNYYYTGPNKWYIIGYQFTDIYGETHDKEFKRVKLEEIKEGNKLTVYYDNNNPDKCVTDYQLKKEKNLWWKSLIITAFFIIIPIILAFTVFEK